MATFDELQKKIGEYVYTEDNGMARIAIASVIATRMKLGDPVWMLVIGPSSGGKSQLLRPLALTDEKFIHRIDDLTENTLLSGSNGEGSLLKQIGSLGIIVISDLTVLFSKNAESRAAILSQLRMVYDGEMVKHVGNRKAPLNWKGALGFIAGSTPSVYQHFEEVADMGERFICYRMKSYDVEKATRISLERRVFGRELDRQLGELYGEYIRDVVSGAADIVHVLSKEDEEKILNIAMFAAKLRTPAHYDKYIRAIDRVPVAEAPMRIALQLRSIALGLAVMRFSDTGENVLSEDDIASLEWCAYSLANEERRACLRVLCQLEYKTSASTQSVADEIGLTTTVAGIHLQHLAAIGILERSGGSGTLAWAIKDLSDYGLIRKLEGVVESKGLIERERVVEEGIDVLDDEDWDVFKDEK